jgi:hypothetical protein
MSTVRGRNVFVRCHKSTGKTAMNNRCQARVIAHLCDGEWKVVTSESKHLHPVGEAQLSPPSKVAKKKSEKGKARASSASPRPSSVAQQVIPHPSIAASSTSYPSQHPQAVASSSSSSSSLSSTLAAIFTSSSPSSLTLLHSFLTASGLTSPSDLSCAVHLDDDLLDWTILSVKRQQGWTDEEERGVREMVARLKEDKERQGGEGWRSVKGD